MDFGFSDRETQVLHLASEGYTDEEIARAIGIEFCTVRTYWDRIVKKTGARSRTHAAALWLASRQRIANAELSEAG